MARHRSQLTTIGDINMTPLIDLTFLLLIVFMITAPLLEYGVDVTPPEMNAEPLPEEDSRIVNLNRKGEIVFNKRTVNLNDLLLELTALSKSNPRLTVLVRADEERKYREVMELMKVVRAAGIQQISLVTQSEGE
jgi:biopolymer transport protein ExbD